MYPLAQMLEADDSRIVMVALEGLESILRSGEGLADAAVCGVNPHLQAMREAFVLEQLRALRGAPPEIADKAFAIRQAHFAGEAGESDSGAKGDSGTTDNGDKETRAASKPGPP